MADNEQWFRSYPLHPYRDFLDALPSVGPEPVPAIYPASPMEAWQMLQTAWRIAGSRINDLPEEYRAQVWPGKPGPNFLPLESPGCYVGYCIGRIFEGLFGLPMGKKEWEW